MSKKFLITNIEYDTDGVTVELPQELEINVPPHLTAYEDIDDFLSDKITDITGYCHTGFSTKLISGPMHLETSTKGYLFIEKEEAGEKITVLTFEKGFDEALAKKMAASEELNTALQDILDVLEEQLTEDAKDNEDIIEAIQQAEAAIQKAN